MSSALFGFSYNGSKNTASGSEIQPTDDGYHNIDNQVCNLIKNGIKFDPSDETIVRAAQYYRRTPEDYLRSRGQTEV